MKVAECFLRVFNGFSFWQVDSFLQARATVFQRQQNRIQNRLLPNKGSGPGIGGFVKVSGGTGVFHPRVSNTTIPTIDVKKKQGEIFPAFFMFLPFFIFYLFYFLIILGAYILWYSWYWVMGSVERAFYGSVCFENSLLCSFRCLLWFLNIAFE